MTIKVRRREVVHLAERLTETREVTTSHGTFTAQVGEWVVTHPNGDAQVIEDETLQKYFEEVKDCCG